MNSHKTVLITGASRGIGHALALTFADHGYALALTCREHMDALQEIAYSCKARQIPCHIFQCDCSDYTAVDRLFDTLQDLNFPVQILINNAGISHVGLLQDMQPWEWSRIINTNLSSSFYTCRRVIPLMLNAGFGKIINISSVWGNVGASCEAAYSASKGGLNTFTKALARELAPSRISVNAIACGAIDTEMNCFLTPEERAALIEEIPAGRMGLPEEVAQFALQLVEAPSYLTGQVIGFDGGWQ